MEFKLPSPYDYPEKEYTKALINAYADTHYALLGVLIYLDTMIKYDMDDKYIREKITEIVNKYKQNHESENQESRISERV